MGGYHASSTRDKILCMYYALIASKGVAKKMTVVGGADEYS